MGLKKFPAFWEANSFTINWGFLLVNVMRSKKNYVGMMWTVRHLWFSGLHLVLNCYHHWS